MGSKRLISVIIPTHNHGWEIEKTLYSLEHQFGVFHEDYEIIVVNTNPKDQLTFDVVKYFATAFKNVRLIQVYDEKKDLIKTACYGGNLGVRQFSKGELLLLCVDSARVPTGMVLNKMRNEFDKWGDNIVTTTTPYHFLKHYSDLSFTVEECREAFLKTRWKQDIKCLFDYAAHTNISKSGRFNESTWLGVTKENFMKVNGYNEIFTDWSDYNLDLWRRFTRPRPEWGRQKVGILGLWGKIGLGLKVCVLEGEADFHLHHSMSDANRNFATLKKLRITSWDEYEMQKDCIRANLFRPDWGEGDCEEILF